MLWSGIFFTFSAISTVIPINKFLLIFLFLNYSRNFFWKSITWRWVWNSISRQVLINNNKIYPGFKYEANISIEFWTVRQTTEQVKIAVCLNLNVLKTCVCPYQTRLNSKKETFCKSSAHKKFISVGRLMTENTIFWFKIITCKSSFP